MRVLQNTYKIGGELQKFHTGKKKIVTDEITILGECF